MRIYHIVLPETWDDFHGTSYEANSLVAEGFIHCSFADQLEAVLKRYYDGRDTVTILEIDPARLTSKLVVEPSTNGESYPHIYGPINSDAIIAAETRNLRQ